VERHPVVGSSMILSLGYEPQDNVLEIEFQNGKIYHYAMVPESVFRDFVNAPSAGDFFLKSIRSRYPFNEVFR
jgi:hypothetical protein